MIVMEGMKEVAMISHMVMGDNHDHIIMLKCNYCLIFILFVVYSIKIKIYEYVRQIIYNG